MILKIVSGGQTGVDRAALDAAIAVGWPTGGWCPRGRRAEDGRIPAIYPLIETEEPETIMRTYYNIRDSDATVVMFSPVRSTGTKSTATLARLLRRPTRVVDPFRKEAARLLVAWLEKNPVSTLNVAGPRESEAPGVYARSYEVLVQAFTRLKESAVIVP